MAFNDQEKQLIIWGKQNGKTADQIESAIAKLRAGIVPAEQQPTEAPAEPGLAERVGNVITNAGNRVADAFVGTGDYKDRSTIGRSVGAVGEAFGAVPAVVTEALPSPARKAIGAATDALGSVVNFIGDKIGNIPALQKWVTEHPQAAAALEETAKTAASGGQIAGTILAAEGAARTGQKAVDLTKAGAQKTAQAVVNAVDAARPATKALYDRSKDLIKPTPTPEKAVGEVLQAKKPITPRELEAFRNIDTKGVKTFGDLEGRIKQSIADLSGRVDDFLAQDTAVIPLDKLVTRTTSTGGRVVERNFVDTALGNLKELYAKTADDAALADIEDLIGKAQQTGLTRLEVNDISRLYNTEFGSKAFSKVGDPLTSVNAQAYENIRAGLKDVARQGMGGTEAAATDKVISSLYNVRDLVSKNVQAVQKLQQRITERGLLEKVGHAVAKYGDILTGGSIRGFVGGLLPRGAGYKLMNALDLEQRLAKNLDIIRKALESGSDDAIIQAARQLDAIPSPTKK